MFKLLRAWQYFNNGLRALMRIQKNNRNCIVNEHVKPYNYAEKLQFIPSKFMNTAALSKCTLGHLYQRKNCFHVEYKEYILKCRIV